MKFENVSFFDPINAVEMSIARGDLEVAVRSNEPFVFSRSAKGDKITLHTGPKK